MHNLPLLALSSLCLAVPVSAQPAAAAAPTPPAAAAAYFNAIEADAVAGKLADALETDFVFPEVGKQYAAMLRARRAAGAYRNAASADAFAAAVTADLQAIHKDAHLKLFAPKAGSGGQRREAMTPPTGSTITASGWIAPGVAYIAFDAFYGNEATMAALKAFLEKVKGANILIIDARHHKGGGLDEMNLMFPELFTKKTALLDMDGRVNVEKRLGEDFGPTVEKIPGPDGVIRRRHFALPSDHPGLGSAKLYLLTSHSTASAAEHMALALKRTHRATVIGETTHGAGNFGYSLSVGYGYSAFIPFGRTFDPDTGQGWEAVGVKPDVEVTADAALDEALKRAGVNVSPAAALASLN
jgi:hypothetical protein